MIITFFYLPIICIVRQSIIDAFCMFFDIIFCVYVIGFQFFFLIKIRVGVFLMSICKIL